MSPCRLNLDVPPRVGCEQARLLVDRLPFIAPAALPVGPGFEVVLMPEAQARRALGDLDRLIELDPVEFVFVFAVDDRWGFFVPEESAQPSWPADVEYLKAGSVVTVPPAHWRHGTCQAGTGWVRRRCDGRLFPPPLILHPILAAISQHVVGAAA
jgi:hypothetical protein